MKFKVFLIGVALATFVFIAYIVTSNEVLTFDTAIREAIYDGRASFLTGVLTFITYIGNWQTVVALCLLTLVYNKTRVRLGIPLAIVAILSSMTYKVIKTFFARPRPDISLHLIDQGGYSFPSGHSMTGFVVYGFILWFILREYKSDTAHLAGGKVNFLKNKAEIYTITTLLSLLIFLIGFSRIYLGVHYPTDVIAGWCLGFAFLSVYTIIITKLFYKHF